MESSEFPLGPHKKYKPGYDYKAFPVVKTHLAPIQIEKKYRSIPSVYLVRDGRDCLVSYAHYRLNIVEPGTNFYPNLKEAILARRRSYWGGGWSKHANAWLKQASVVIKFEEMIANPIENVEKLRQIMDLPEPKIENLPSFDDLRSRRMPYGNLAPKRSEDEQDAHRKKFFRKGEVGTWREEMPEDLHELFWIHHGTAMDKLGYQEGKVNVPAAKSWINRAINNFKLY